MEGSFLFTYQVQNHHQELANTQQYKLHSARKCMYCTRRKHCAVVLVDFKTERDEEAHTAGRQQNTPRPSKGQQGLQSVISKCDGAKTVYRLQLRLLAHVGGLQCSCLLLLSGSQKQKDSGRTGEVQSRRETAAAAASTFNTVSIWWCKKVKKRRSLQGKGRKYSRAQ